MGQPKFETIKEKFDWAKAAAKARLREAHKMTAGDAIEVMSDPTFRSYLQKEVAYQEEYAKRAGVGKVAHVLEGLLTVAGETAADLYVKRMKDGKSAQPSPAPA